MGLLDFLGREKSEGRVPACEFPLEQSCYDVAYFVLPRYVFGDVKAVIRNVRESPHVAGFHYYLMACQMRSQAPDAEFGREFVWHIDSLTESIDCLTLEYPPPSPFCMDDEQMLDMVRHESTTILSPYLSTIVYGKNIETEYYVLGQAPFGDGTTFRQVSPAGVNYNLGRGPAPSLEAFLEAIRLKRRS